MIDNRIRDQLLFRAGYKCEYCRKAILGDGWEIDHICPRSTQGPDDLDNLAVACPRCNLNKGGATKDKDYVTGRILRLFNPRTDNWNEHFGAVAGQLVGRSPIGRATAKRLLRRTEQRLPPDLCWWPLADLADERLYMFLNHQRARRLENKFIDLKRALDELPFLDGISTTDQQFATFAAQLLIAESLYTRSSPEDVCHALDMVTSSWKLPGLDVNRQAELLNVTSVILQQLATIMSLEGRDHEAQLIQERASKAYATRLEMIGGGNTRDKLRLQGLQRKYSSSDHREISSKNITESIREAKHGNVGALTYAADILACKSSRFSKTETVLEALNEVLLSIGYGQDFDYAYSIVIRRRWWILQAFLGLPVDLDLLESDLQFWISVHMQNEIRELAAMLRQLHGKLRNKTVKDMRHVVESYLNYLRKGNAVS